MRSYIIYNYISLRSTMSISYYQLIIGVLTALAIANLGVRLIDWVVNKYYDWQDKKIFLEWEEEQEELDNE